VVCVLDGGHPHVCVTPQASEACVIHAQDICKGWQPIYGHWCLIIAPPPGMAWWFADPVESWPTVVLVYGLNGGHPHVCVTSQACETFPIHTQDICKGWQPIYGHWYLIS